MELAADIRQKNKELDAIFTAIRQNGGEWTDLSMAGEDALGIAKDGLRNCMTMLRRVHSLSEIERRRTMHPVTA